MVGHTIDNRDFSILTSIGLPIMNRLGLLEE